MYEYFLKEHNACSERKQITSQYDQQLLEYLTNQEHWSYDMCNSTATGMCCVWLTLHADFQQSSSEHCRQIAQWLIVVCAAQGQNGQQINWIASKVTKSIGYTLYAVFTSCQTRKATWGLQHQHSDDHQGLHEGNEHKIHSCCNDSTNEYDVITIGHKDWMNQWPVISEEGIRCPITCSALCTSSIVSKT